MLPLSPGVAVLLGRIDLTLLYPPFADRYIETIVACRDRGVAYYATSGVRDDAEQLALYAKGRASVNGLWEISNH